ncbi:Cytochrome c oxidase subunit 1 [Pirellulimonas nuda]|uniref:Cytochrome c oxidase subunit 1 n=1 Tax=Pirellulimonas nuda TaxID=2528009 RepID=A0A518DJH8_9BACT|nr:cytochrome c oxidase subunit I [Pirellulimonas nuda]QDU91625.1 Cytochrome c oxidase subunit 1 [Pirellulimonas nuda]
MIAHTSKPLVSGETGRRVEIPEGPSYLTGGGLMSWAFTLDHKRIGVMYLCGILGFFLIGGLLAILIRLELWNPAADLLAFGQGADATARAEIAKNNFNQVFTLHGAIMVFLFIIPSIPAALGNFVVPIMVGAKDVAFPRLNLASFHLYFVGACFFIAALLTTGLDTGWTFYTPYSVTTTGPVVLATMGVFILGFSSIFTGLNFIVTINTMRPRGMTWFRMPLFLWSIYATSIIQVLATPVLAITLLLLMTERMLGIGIFDSARGGDPVLFQHFFWFYSHPAVYIMILPAMGVISEVIPTFSRKHIFGYRFIAYSSIAIALIGFLVWGHHMFTSGQSALATAIFSFLTFAVAIPSAIKVFNWLATMYKGSIHFNTPMCYAISFMALFTIGGLTGLPLGALATDIHLHDTYFVVAHFHYVMMGGTLISFLAALFYWWPKLFGRMYNERFGQLSAIIVFIGFNLTFFTQFILGVKGMPRRYASYEGSDAFPVTPELLETFTTLHRISTVGALILGAGLFIAAGTLIASLWYGRKAPANPWGAATLEWKCCSPPTQQNFEVNPIMGPPYVYDDIKYDPAIDGYYEVVPDRTTKPMQDPV